MGEFLKKVGVSDSEFKLDDGCGLSKQNVISASAMVKTLTYDFFSPFYLDTWSALSGAVGMTYETDGGGSLARRRSDETSSM